MNKSQLVKEHLINKGSITSWEAIQAYGATRLSAIIFNLRQKGYDIRTLRCEGLDRYGNESNFAKYVYKGKD